MSSQPPPQGPSQGPPQGPPQGPEGGAGGAGRPSFAEENAMRIASESLQHYDQASDTYHVSYGPPVPAVTVHDPERGVLVRVEPRSQQVVGFSIPSFKAWHAEHAEDDGEFEIDLPSVWPLGGDAGPAEAQDPTPEG